ncbi:M23 family metallopeptidase [Xanthocytophaga flava]|uniref:M23 family metallopeptidase n=1 Tax=Xanthocytophaga flava TaxID=3048013 RepID=UPI0028D49C7D|nr:M23 family metallopeptidase [Xanthocytophaga flavus]MDJ1470272.1 M23 family metallopeptidase [Xanthocytophaga flavus]
MSTSQYIQIKAAILLAAINILVLVLPVLAQESLAQESLAQESLAQKSIESNENAASVRSDQIEKLRLIIWKRWASVTDSVFFKEYKITSDNWLRKHVPSIPPIRPEEGKAKLTSSFGWRKHPILGKEKFHNGIDLAAAPGQAVYSTAQGIIEKVGYDPIIGNYITLNHTGLFKTIYGHLSATLVKAGKWVDRDQLIGLVGNTGRSTGYHLHYIVKKNNIAVNADPYLFLRYGVGY